jgi:hypothetical protein
LALAVSTARPSRIRVVASSSFGLARFWAELDAERQARADGFTDPGNQCVEVFALEALTR